jgi:serum/glucocorticoid-regulated kinase 2
LTALKDEENASIGISPTTTNDDVAQQKTQLRSGFLIVSLHEGVGISLPEHYKQLLDGRNDQQSTEPRPNIVPGGEIYALLDFDQSQVLVPATSGTVEHPLWAGCSRMFDLSPLMELSVYLYLRSALSTRDAGRIQDICLGVARIRPKFEEHDRFEDLKTTELTIAELNQQNTISRQKWLELEYGTGKIRVSVDVSENKTQLLQMQDFVTLKSLGNSSSKKVFQVRKRDSGQVYALKKIQKTSMFSQAEVADAFEIAKRSVLSQIKNPFLVSVKFAFQSPEGFCMVSPFVHGGELIELLNKGLCYGVDSIRLYTAEILCALEFLHDFDIIYGDLKPQNILLDYSGHVSVCDFGLYMTEKIDESCESPYRAPEISLGQAYTEVVDWWTLGILLAEMLTGLAPSWYDEGITGTNSNIESFYFRPRNGGTMSFYFPDIDVVPPLAQDISIKLFHRDPEQRLGAKGVAEIKVHPFFNDIDWRRVLQRGYEPVFKPNNADFRLDTNPQDHSDFLPMSKEEAQKLSEATEKLRGMFAGWDT